MEYGRFKFAAASFFAVFFLVARIAAAVMDGEPVALSQPDGSEVTVRLFGTSYFSTAESPDGYTLIRDADGWICYAELSADGSEYVSTGVRYTAGSRAPNVRRNLRINERSMMEKRSRNIRALGDGEEESLRRFWDKVDRHERRRSGGQSGNPSAPPSEDEFRHAPRSVVGLVLFISFRDFPAPTGSVNDRWLRHVDSVYNSSAYTRGSGAGYGSVYNYFQDVSGGQMDYTNYISVFVQAPNDFEYYDGADNYGRVSELITAALNALNQNTAVANEIANRISRHPGTHGGKNRPAVALNIHPIRSGQRWSHGIWSHRGWYRGTATVGGVPFYDYQFSGLGNSGTITNSTTLSTNVIIHENGHMLFDWPDLYSYVNGRAFVGNYCVMASGVVMPNPFFRDLEGWITVTDVTGAPGAYTHNANSNTAFVFNRTGITGTNANRERYYIESRFSNGRSSGIPGSGLVIWHIHTGGNNTDYDPSSNQAARRTPRVAVVQANNGTGIPNNGATFTSANGRNMFDSTTTPRARWHTANGAAGDLWNGPNNGLRVSNISAAPTASNPRMTFSIGYGGGAITPATYGLQVVGGTGSGNYEAGTSVNVSANTASGDNAFLRWTSTPGISIPDVYVSSVTVRTGPQADTIRAHNALVNRLPGTVQGESYGYVSSNNFSTAGTSNPALNVSGSGSAEYLINSTAGVYDISYRVASQNGGRFFVRRVSPGNDTAIDTVDVPATGSSTAYQTVTKTGKILTAGSQVWSVVRATGSFRLDWFTVTAQVTDFTLTVANGGSGGGAYEPGTNVDVSASAARNGLSFVRWSTSNSAVIPEDIYDRQGSVTTISANVTLTPHYGRVHPIPATSAIPRIECDTFAYAHTVVSETNGDATGGRLGALFSIGDIAEYAVNVTAAGTYKFKYRIMTNGGTVDRAFRLRDETNGVTLDSVTVPRSAISNTYMEITEISGNRTALLSEGPAVWQIESTDGPAAATTVAMLYLDWFTAEPARAVLDVVGGEGSGEYDVGDIVTVSAVVPDGYEFVRWEGYEVADSASPVTTVVIGINTNIVLTAVFEEPATSVRRRANRVPMRSDIRVGSAGRISYAVAHTEAVSIKVYDMRGREVATLVNGVMNPGYYSVNLSAASRLGKGVYFVRMRGGSFSKDVKLNFVR